MQRSAASQVQPMALTVQQLAQALGIGQAFAWELVGRGVIPSVKIGKCRRVTVEALAEYLRGLEAEQNRPPARVTMPVVHIGTRAKRR